MGIVVRFLVLWVVIVVLPTSSLLGQSPGAEPPAAEQNAEKKPEKLTAKGVEFFESKIRPVLTQRCYSCHSSQSKELKGGLALDTRDSLRKGGENGVVVVPGNPDDSPLIQAIRHESFEMPPGDKLAENVIADFEEWVRMGAPDPRVGKNAGSKRVSLADSRSFWAYSRPAAAPVPQVKNQAWPRTAIDQFILARLENKQLQPVRDADRETLARRIYFDLTGLPPTPAELDAFLGDHGSDAVERLIDHLLDSPRFGERWGRHWLDVARYGESTGKERNIPFPYAWRYRDYVIDAFNQDKPYDRFIREQVAGDLLQASTNEGRNEMLVATGFLALGPKSLNERNREQYLMDQADEQIDVITRVVMGTTVACARCHDHKFDPITQTDYYAMAGVFRSTEVYAGVQAGNNKTGYSGKFAYLESDGPKPELSPEQAEELKRLSSELAELKAKRQNLSKLETGKKKGAKKKAEDVVAKMDARIERLSSQLKALQGQRPAGTEPVMAVGDASRPANARINIRGEVKELGDEVPRGVPLVLSFDRAAKFDTDHSGRAQIASWLVSKDNPLTARVMANRIWAHLFGKGLVESVDNFGTLGDEPSHPELLDHLALRFVSLNWSVKKLIKEIMLTRVYQLSSEHDDAAYAVDPDNKLLWRMNRRRLEAEAIRDAILAVSGQLDLKRPQGSLVQDNGANELGRGKRNDGLDLTKARYRSVYLPMVRGRVPEMLAVFDVADPSLVVGQRDVTTVATQALFMMNSPLVIEQSEILAKQLLSGADRKDRDRVELAFRTVVGHPPTAPQLERSLAFLRDTQQLAGDSASARETAWASFCQTLLASAEFRYVY